MSNNSISLETIENLNYCNSDLIEQLKQYWNAINCWSFTVDEIYFWKSIFSSLDYRISYYLRDDIIKKWNEINSSEIRKTEHLTVSEILIILELMESENPENENIKVAIDNTKEAIQIMTSTSFYVVYNYLLQNYNWKLNHSDLLSLWNNDLDIVIWKSFLDFLKQIEIDLWINFWNLQREVEIYKTLLSNQELKTKLLETYKTLKKEIPEIPQNTNFLASLLDFIQLQWENLNIDKIVSNYHALTDIYWQELMNVDIEYHWIKVISNLSEQNSVSILSSNIAKEIRSIIKYNDELLGDSINSINDLFLDYSVIRNCIDFFQNINITLLEFNSLLQACWLDLAEDNINIYEWMSDVIPENINLLLDWDWFKLACDKLFIDLPKLRDWFNFYDWIYLVESYLQDWNLDKIHEINFLLNQLWVDWVNLDANNADAKISILKQLQNLHIPVDQFDWYCLWWFSWNCLASRNIEWSIYFLDSWRLLNIPEISQIINNPNFPDFVGKVEIYFPNINWDSDIPYLALLFGYIVDNPDSAEMLFSDQFKKLCEYLVENFEFVESRLARNDIYENIPIWALRKILPIANDFPYEKFDELIGQLNSSDQKLVANDIMLLYEITRNPDLYKMFIEDIDELIKKIEDNLWEKVERNKYWDLQSDLEFAVESGNQKLLRKTQWLIDIYTERPDLSSFDLLDIMRIRMIQMSLNDEQFLKDLATILIKDLSDSPEFEHWGYVMFDNNKLKIQEIQSMYEPPKQNNNYEDNEEYWDNNSNDIWWAAYENYDYEPMHWWLVSFHFHATKINETEYAWPSWYYWLNWDFPTSEKNNAPDIVFSTLWYPKDQDWNDITDKILVNVDYYFVSSDLKHVVVDLWIIELPLNDL